MTKITRRHALGMTASATVVLPFMAASAHAASHATVHAVTIKNFTFEPADLTINVGDSVAFTNEDSAPHTATDANGAFDTGRLNKGGTAQMTFGGVGSFDYVCTFHPRMKGKITIT